MINFKFLVIIALIVLAENIALFVGYNIYSLSKSTNDPNDRLIISQCDSIGMGSSFDDVLVRVKGQYPWVSKDMDNTILHFNISAPSSAGVALMFNKDLKLIKKSCNRAWEPEN